MYISYEKGIQVDLKNLAVHHLSIQVYVKYFVDKLLPILILLSHLPFQKQKQSNKQKVIPVDLNMITSFLWVIMVWWKLWFRIRRTKYRSPSHFLCPSIHLMQDEECRAATHSPLQSDTFFSLVALFLLIVITVVEYLFSFSTIWCSVIIFLLIWSSALHACIVLRWRC